MSEVESNVISLKSLTPPRYEGELDPLMVQKIAGGTEIPKSWAEMCRRLAHELLKTGFNRTTPDPEKFPESTCVECGQSMPAGQIQRCPESRSGYCTWHKPAALAKHYTKLESQLQVSNENEHELQDCFNEMETEITRLRNQLVMVLNREAATTGRYDDKLDALESHG